MKMIKIKHTDKRSGFTEGQIISIGFMLIILLGAILLMFPFASRDGSYTSFLQTLFTATSATCVTGLVVVDTYSHWSVFGQIIIITLIQIGGMGFVTIGVFFSIIFKRKIGLKFRGLMQESISSLQIGGILRLVKSIIRGTILFEGIGAILLSIRFIPRFGVVKGIYYSVFHSVSAFCNAGFDLMGYQEEYCSLVSFYDDILVNVVIMSLIVIGGIGFIVWEDIKDKKLKFSRYHLHTKMVLTMTAILIVVPAILFAIFEWNGVMEDFSVKGKILSSLFCSITPRTAGFNTVDMAAMSDSGKLLTIMLMFIGGSPGSTAGGIKTITFLILILGVKSLLFHEKDYEIYGRRIDDESIKKASVVFNFNLFLAMSATSIIMAIEAIPFSDIMFEVFSAIGTAGISTGITRDLNDVSRLVIIFLMYCGRVGSLSFALSFTRKKRYRLTRYPSEKVTVG